MEMHEQPAILDSEESRVDRVVIYEGRGPSCRDAIWTSGTTRVAWIGVTGRGKARVPSGSKWRVYRRSVKHAALGGVTDATFSCFLASKFVEDHSWELLGTGMRATLRQVVDLTNGGRNVEPPQELGRVDTAGGLSR